MSDDDFQITVSRNFPAWLAQQKSSIAFTHPPLKVFLIGLKRNGQLSIYERTFPRCLGIAGRDSDTIFVTSRHQIWRLENGLRRDQLVEDEYDRQFIPRKVYTTGYMGTHDVAVDKEGRLIFVNTRFGCLATVSDEVSFTPLWRPNHLKNVSFKEAGDRCHLNGLAMKDGQPAYVTSVSQTDVIDGWRDRRKGGGVVIDVPANEVVCAGLSMPHSPRWYRGKLWLTNSGTGHFGFVDFARGAFEPVAWAPAFLRGLCFIGEYAVVGASRPREGDVYSGLGLDEQLRAHNATARMGLFVININTGNIENWLFIESDLREVYDAIALPGARAPMAVGIVSDEIDTTYIYDSALRQEGI